MKTLAIIPARGGSKGVPGKNIKPLAGKPLIQYTIEAAREVFADEDICISTDSSEIIQVVHSQGLEVPFVRPENLATDTSSTYDVLLHALEHYKQKGKEYDIVVLLQATSPFRTGDHIREAISLYNQEVEMIVSVTETSSNPYFVLFEEDNDGFLRKSKEGKFSSRQECPKVWEYNGAVYVINAAALQERSHLQFRKVKKYIMKHEDSLDIDTPLDWDFAELMMSRRNIPQI
ncbi:cytidylyltransferase domain-containing protein [Pseudobacter ginsenosidimutans]|uniref:N-acylneuraminate cytidylyltransferase n=1 Tax=Pseudobacter ginsenosidimutans TaxID=661488 RepID=A0A4Q7MVZ1_9BACT|nr:acylneuraminate cytidylyltransferase family protein [Pseudobacter ginsenosidimutans]QEC41044.1 acylneuraminate cytidylyltransferase family protein [Pseudobacter ginsenosidimutans]RZS72204.1 N-acylneuraminate cytidylyltransferase [Pseudobacter ginsenosidimutans]